MAASGSTGSLGISEAAAGAKTVTPAEVKAVHELQSRLQGRQKLRIGCDAWMIAPETEVRAGQRSTYGGKVLLLLSPRHPLRATAIELVEDVWFDRIVLLFIFTNCITMAAADPLSSPTSGAATSWSDVLEWVFTALFTIEMGIKMLAMGVTPLESRTSYFSEGWNCLDGFVVLVS